MKTFTTFIKADWQGMCRTPRNYIVMLIILFITLFFVQSGVLKYKNIGNEKMEFQGIERLKAESYKRIEDYGIMGFRIFFIPEPAIIFFVNTTIYFNLTSFIDTGDALDMDQSCLGKKLYSERKVGFKDFSGVMFFITSLAVLCLGIFSISHPEFRKFLASVAGQRKVYLLLISSRGLFILLFLFIVTVCSVLLVLLNHITLPARFYSHMAGFFAVMYGEIIFFYSLGTLLGTMKNRASSVLLGIGLWFGAIFLVPGAIDHLVSKQAERIDSNYQYDLEKLKQAMGFEDRAKKEVGEYDPAKKHTKEVRDVVKSYLEKEYLKILKLEQKREAAMRQLLKTYNLLSC
ncbi:MAG: hypothetical protein JSV88_14145, partial [Candidatus Aminicenantes bacterium]